MPVREFDSLEEMFAEIEEQSRTLQAAMANHPIKVEDLRHGDHFAVARLDLGLVIFGEVIETTEYEEDNEAIVESRSRGWIFGRCFSPLCAEGELGDTHVVRISAKISKAVFERARANGWRHLMPSN